MKDDETWVFKTVDVDYGLYWFKNGSEAMKYVPGREMDKEFYDPEKPNMIMIHGWQPFYTALVGSDYRRDPLIFSSGRNSFHVDMVDIWKDPLKNSEGKSWNMGVFYWGQIADGRYNAYVEAV